MRRLYLRKRPRKNNMSRLRRGHASPPIMDRVSIYATIGFNIFMVFVKFKNRISFLQFHINRTKSRRVKLAIINVYSPTSKLISSNSDVATAFYDKLHQTIDIYERQSYFTYIVGDFNSELGTQLDDTEAIIGQFGEGTRNRNGHLLANFLAEHQYFAANTIFKHHMRRRSTWYGHIQGKHIYNQIDYTANGKKAPNRLSHRCSIIRWHPVSQRRISALHT